MRKMVLIGAMVLLSTAAAQAGEARSLSLATTDSAVTRPVDTSQRTAEMAQPAPVTTEPAAGASPSAAAPVATTPAAATQPPGRMSRRQHAARISKPRRGRWSEARIVSELHRHGIYW